MPISCPYAGIVLGHIAASLLAGLFAQARLEEKALQMQIATFYQAH